MSPRIVLIGAGSAMFGFGTLGDIFKSKILEGSTIVLVDINSSALKAVESIARRHIEEKGLNYQLIATTNREEALQGADFCAISIEVGNRYELWEMDWKIPLQYGIPQVYGENGGPGGLFHSLRIIPPILEICEDIQRICPDALVFNFSNPMSRICTTIYRKFPDLKVVGLCHEAFSLPINLPCILNTPVENLEIVAGGLNHFGVLLKATYKDTGQDAYPEIRKKAPEYYANFPEHGLFMEILSRFGYLPITTDSHFGEYVHWAHDVVDHKGILDFYTNYKKSCLEDIRPLEVIASGTTDEEGWRFIPIMEEIITNAGAKELVVDIKNDGFITNIPDFLSVEVPAIVDKNGVHGVKVGDLPRGIAGLLNNQAAVHDLTAEAVLTGSKDIVFQALLVDPVVNSVHKAEAMLNTILCLQKDYLGYIQ